MWENGNMRTHADKKHVSFVTLPEIRNALKRAVTHTLEAAPEGTIEGHYNTSHHVEAAVCWLLTQPQEVQDRVILEGRTIARKLVELDTPAKDFPAAYRPASVVPVGGGHDRGGKNTEGGPTSVPKIVARNTGKPARRARGDKKRPKTEGAPAAGVRE